MKSIGRRPFLLSQYRYHLFLLINVTVVSIKQILIGDHGKHRFDRSWNRDVLRDKPKKSVLSPIDYCPPCNNGLSQGILSHDPYIPKRSCSEIFRKGHRTLVSFLMLTIVRSQTSLDKIYIPSRLLKPKWQMRLWSLRMFLHYATNRFIFLRLLLQRYHSFE